MKRITVICCFVAACNYDTGECYLRHEGAAGAGGGIITPTGVGGFGDVPREPQGAADPPPPECNIAAQSPCYEKCEADYEAAAIACAKITDEGQKKSCDDAAYGAYRGCREKCKRAANTDCDDKYQDSVNNGPTKCLKKSAGKTVCYRCWERCNAGDTPSAACKECKF